ncbi:MAG: GAF domain-containing sensor histidine kinase [Anaerolineales bacterium]|nr:GAF domain-containing sensor histidine kinase [Anaerolineales bacterium]
MHLTDVPWSLVRELATTELGDGAAAPVWLAFGLPVVLWLSDFLGKREPASGRDATRDRGRRVDELEHELARLKLIIRKSAELNLTLNYDRVLTMVVDLCTSAIANGAAEDTRLVGGLLLFQDDELSLETGRGFSPADMRVRLPGRDGLLGQALQRGTLQAAVDPAHDPEIKRFAAVQVCQAAVCVPLIVGMEAYGALLFAHPVPGYFNEERLELLEAVSQQAVTALQNSRLYRELEVEKERIAESQEEARKKLARDLHDGPTQSVGAIAMRVNFARRLIERNPMAAADELFKIEELARRTSKEIRQMLFTLRPLVLETEGLVPALQYLANQMKETHDQQVIIEASPEAVEELEVGKQGVLFFIAEEALNNARKHARADHVWVRMQRDGDLLHLEVADDGVGFDVRSVEADYERRGSLGMLNLRERTELVSGVLHIDSGQGQGTRIHVVVPLTIEAGERLHRHGFAG